VFSWAKTGITWLKTRIRANRNFFMGKE